MDRGMTLRSVAGWSAAAVVVGVLTAAELLIAADLLATGDYSGWHNWPIGAGYVALVGFIAVRLGTQRTSARYATLELLAVDTIALPVAIAVLSM